MSKKNKEKNKIYNTRYWKKLRQVVLDRDPLCVKCLKKKPPKLTPAKVADHVVNWQQNAGTSFDVPIEGLQGLCKPCHKEKTDEERSEAYKKEKIKEHWF